MANYNYIFYGLKVRSEFRIRGLHDKKIGEPDISIHAGRLPQHIPKISSKGLLFEATKDDFLFHFEKFGVSFRILSGKKIIVDLKKSEFLVEHEVLLMTSVIGVLLHQRSLLPLHGSSISTEQGKYIFIGKSASGKSSLAAEFYFNGYQIISDDIATISSSSNNQLMLHKGLPYLKLWENVLRLYSSKTSFQPVRHDLNKYIVPIKSGPETSTSKIAAIIVLSTNNTSDFKIHKISGIDRIKVLKVNTYRNRFVNVLGQEENQFKVITSLARECDFFLLERPKSPILLKELREFIEKKIIYPDGHEER